MKCAVLGDASAALGIIRRVGLGRTRHVDTAWLWVQEKNAEKQIKYDKICGSSNPADLMTKGLPGDRIRDLLRIMGMETTKAVDKKALTTRELNIVGSKGLPANVKEELKSSYRMNGEFEAWTRYDLGASTFKSSMKGGPDWSSVLYRITKGEGNDILDVDRAPDIESDEKHRRIPGGPRDLTTVLLYRSGWARNGRTWTSSASVTRSRTC